MALEKETKPEQFTKVALDEMILCTITFGNAQIGGNVIRWKGSQVVLAKGEIKNLKLGFGMDIKGKTLRITSNVLDVNPSSNGIVINHFFGGASPALFAYDYHVKSDGNVYQLITEYTFK